MLDGENVKQRGSYTLSRRLLLIIDHNTVACEDQGPLHFAPSADIFEPLIFSQFCHNQYCLKKYTAAALGVRFGAPYTLQAFAEALELVKVCQKILQELTRYCAQLFSSFLYTNPLTSKLRLTRLNSLSSNPTC